MNSDDFKKLVRILNYLHKTEYEQLQENKQNFKEIMPYLRGLDEKEAEIFIHKILNSSSDDRIGDDLLTEMSFNEIEGKLAKLSEDANF